MAVVQSLLYVCHVLHSPLGTTIGGGAGGAGGAGARSEGEHPPSKIGRPISPGLKSTYGMPFVGFKRV